MEECSAAFRFNPIEIARITSTLAIVLAGFSFLVLAQGIQAGRRSETFNAAALEMFGLSFLGLVVAAFLNAIIVGEGELTQRAFVLAMAQNPLLISSILLLALDSAFLLERHLGEPSRPVWMLAVTMVLLGAAYSMLTALDLLATAYGDRTANIPGHHLTWSIGAYALAIVVGILLGRLVKHSLKGARALIYILTVLSSGIGVAVLSEVYQTGVPTVDVAAIAGGYTLLGGLNIAALLAVALQLRGAGVDA